MNSRYRRLTAWIAATAIVLQALWPLLSHARPKDPSYLVPLCTIDGITHYLELKAGKQTPLDKRSATHGEHCKLCVFSSDREVTLAPLEVVSFVVPDPNGSEFISQPDSFSKPASHPPAQPRAPPAFS